MDIYKLYRNFWDFSFNNPEKIKPNHVAVYSFSIEHCNRLGWKEKFGFPTSMVLDATGIKSYSVYKKTFDDLVSFGFIHVVEYSKNQYSSNIIALKENCKANCKALDKALTKHVSKQSESTYQSTCQSTDSIDKQLYNNTSIPNTNLLIEKENQILTQKSVGKFSQFNIQDAPPKILQDAFEAWVYSTDIEMRKKITIDHVKDKWLQFYATNKDSPQWYNSENEIYTHFKRWITKQKFEINGKSKYTSVGKEIKFDRP